LSGAEGTAPSKITEAGFFRILQEGMPGWATTPLEFLLLERGRVVVRLEPGPENLRPGGTVAGPFLFALADLATYAVVLSVVGEVPLAVTTDATIHFLRRPTLGPLIARGRILKHGRRLAVGDVVIEHEDEPGSPVAHGIMTYSIPPA
jgi:uncharacterized protein (TIGR00369 family)